MSIEALETARILRAVGGTQMGNLAKMPPVVTDVVIDSRAATDGALYVPIIGERFDGHDFIAAARENGASLALSDRKLDSEAPYILVENTLGALQAIAGMYRSLFAPFVVAVTGSAGKTTTKEMIALVLAEKHKTLKTEGNLNNQTGVPQMLLRLDKDTRAAVIEMGMNHPGEIDSLARMVMPNVLVVTNIGTAHIEYLGSREGILAAKLEAVPHVKGGGAFIFNGDDGLLAGAVDRVRSETGNPVYLFGLGNECDIRATAIESHGLDGTSFEVRASAGGRTCRFPVRLGCPGEYLVYSALSAVACGLLAGVPEQSIADALARYQPVGSRMRIMRHGGLTILDDTYNANLPATQAALAVLSEAKGAKIAILGEMRELGDASENLHEQAIESALKSGARMVAGVGPLYRRACQKAWKKGPVLWFGTQEELLKVLDAQLDAGDTILVKGSRGMHMEKTVRHLLGEDTEQH